MYIKHSLRYNRKQIENSLLDTVGHKRKETLIKQFTRQDANKITLHDTFYLFVK